MAAKKMPRAGRAHKTAGAKPAPVKKGLTAGSARQRASLDVPFNPLGSTNGPIGGSGRPAKQPVKVPPPRPKPQGGKGS